MQGSILILMRHKKIRGHKRRLKQIEHWQQRHCSTSVEQIVSKYHDHYARIRIYPWNGFTQGNSKTPEPKGKTRAAMVNGLLAIYDSWKKQLDTLGEPYYLKIWLYEPNFTQSEVVCAIGKKLHFYDATFLKGNDAEVLNTKQYGNATAKMETLTWEHYIEEDHYENDYVDAPEMYASLQDFYDTNRWFSRMLKKPHRTTTYDEPIGDSTEFYSFKKGNVWIGGK